jgi:hypothetical protein
MQEVSFVFQKLLKIILILFQDSPIDHPNEAYIKEVICIPQKGDWGGGDKIVIIMPKPIEQKGSSNHICLFRKSFFVFLLRIYNLF